jgi:hypothetical protein
MVALNFSPEFAGLVACGRKTQTIRQNARVKPGQRIQLYTGQRTKACQKLGEAVCTEVKPVELNRLFVTFDGETLGFGGSLQFAIADGFRDYEDMWTWFRDRYGLNNFRGYVIRWAKEDSKP